MIPDYKNFQMEEHSLKFNNLNVNIKSQVKLSNLGMFHNF